MYILENNGKNSNEYIFFKEVYMENSKLKNMVVLRNLPSNIVEEAIVILKSNKEAKKLERVEKNEKTKKIEKSKKDTDYVLKEAEMLVSSYIRRLENTNNQKKLKTSKNNKKYIRLKNYAYLSSLIILIQALMLIIN